MASAVTGLAGLFAIMFFFAFPTSDSLEEIASFLMFAGFFSVFALLGASFVTGAMLLIIGLPVAWVLGARIRERWSLFLAVVVAILASFLAGSFAPSYSSDQPYRWFDGWPALIFGLPAAFFYRHYVIANLMDEDDAF
ncbi:hypothetical protein [Erythrobacter sp.]|uniref:hypothetical protein n=1 Tax=Erythrobacter sp. TaxID=1042 RepID=UPI002EB2B92F|nr:hypothetical protein [Erythrobacter sp.]